MKVPYPRKTTSTHTIPIANKIGKTAAKTHILNLDTSAFTVTLKTWPYNLRQTVLSERTNVCTRDMWNLRSVQWLIEVSSFLMAQYHIFGYLVSYNDVEDEVVCCRAIRISQQATCHQIMSVDGTLSVAYVSRLVFSREL